MTDKPKRLIAQDLLSIPPLEGSNVTITHPLIARIASMHDLAVYVDMRNFPILHLRTTVSSVDMIIASSTDANDLFAYAEEWNIPVLSTSCEDLQTPDFGEQDEPQSMGYVESMFGGCCKDADTEDFDDRRLS